MRDQRPVLRLLGLQPSDARELADSVGPEATVVAEELPPMGGYGDLGRRTVAVIVTARSMRAVARYCAARPQSHGEPVTLRVEIDGPDGARRPETLSFAAAPGQATAEAAANALRALPGIGEALNPPPA